MRIPEFLLKKIEGRIEKNALRILPKDEKSIDFSSNDYLGFANDEFLFEEVHRYLVENKLKKNGGTGSRLISGNYSLYEETESLIANFHQSESAIIFNSGYDANIGLLSSILNRNDIVFYDEWIHASIRDGIQLSNSKSFKFRHNDIDDLESRLKNIGKEGNVIYIVTESVFSMDGDSPNFKKLINLSKKYNCFLIVDEAHALGVFGKKGEGLIQSLGFENEVFARVVTFGKGLGCHGAAILGSKELKQYLVNFARSFIYTTSLPPHSIATIFFAYKKLIKDEISVCQLKKNIIHFKKEITDKGYGSSFVNSNSAIQCIIVSGNKKVKDLAIKIKEQGFEVKAILSPTVPEGQERLRFCLHAYNSKFEISTLIDFLSTIL